MSNVKFDEGALFAMEKVNEVLEKRRKELEAARNTGCGRDVLSLLNSLENYLTGLKIELEMHLVKELTLK